MSAARRRRSLVAHGTLCAALAAVVSIATLTAAGAFTGWSIVPSPDRGTGINALTRVSCDRANSCTAVGYSYDTGLGAYRSLIESRHRTGWSIVPSPNNGTGDNEFLGVSCASARSCMAVGFYDASGTSRTLIESWSGHNWSIVPSPNHGTVNNILAAVSCVSARSCQAVGYSYDSSIAVQTLLIESWNGVRWSIVPSPNNGTAANILDGVSCHSRRSCQAVGYYYDTTLGAYQTLIESWNGDTWSIVPSANNGTNGNYLLSVSCRSPRACQAVGQYYNTRLGTYQTLIESLHGETWSIVPSANNGMKVNDLIDVSCQSPRSCQAVGGFFDTRLGDYQTLIESWNGHNWSIVPSPDQGTAYNVLSGVACGHARRSCTAVGNFFNASLSTYQNLIESTG